MMDTVRFIQQENLRLRTENETLQQDNTTLENYLNMVQTLYWAGQTINTEAGKTLLLCLVPVLATALKQMVQAKVASQPKVAAESHLTDE